MSQEYMKDGGKKLEKVLEILSSGPFSFDSLKNAVKNKFR
jgi:hypothetical protein